MIIIAIICLCIGVFIGWFISEVKNAPEYVDPYNKMEVMQELLELYALLNENYSSSLHKLIQQKERGLKELL